MMKINSLKMEVILYLLLFQINKLTYEFKVKILNFFNKTKQNCIYLLLLKLKKANIFVLYSHNINAIIFYKFVNLY